MAGRTFAMSPTLNCSSLATSYLSYLVRTVVQLYFITRIILALLALILVVLFALLSTGMLPVAG